MKQLILLIVATFFSLSVTVNAQWTNDTAVNTLVSNEESNDMKAIGTSDGQTYVVYWKTVGSGYELRLQVLDVDGNQQLGANGMLVSNTVPMSSFTVAWTATVDANDNIYIGVTGTANTSAYAFKLDINGNHIWGTNGLNVGSGYSVTILPLANGEAIVSWFPSGPGVMQKYDASGNAIWSSPQPMDGTLGATIPADLFEMSNGDYVMVFHDLGSGTSSTLYAQKYNGAGAAQWGAATQLSNKTTAFNATYSGSQDGDNVYYGYVGKSGSRFDSYVQRINPDGSLPWGINGMDFDVNQTDYEMDTKIAMPTGSQYVWATCTYTNSSQSENGESVQKFDKNSGVRQLTDNGKVVFPISGDFNKHASDLYIENDQFFFMQQSGADNGATPTTLHAVLLDSNGDFVWSPQTKPMGTFAANKNRTHLTLPVNGQAVGVFIEDKGAGERMYAQNFTEFEDVQCTFEPTITITPNDADNMYCPNDIVTLTTEVSDSYQWFYNFSNSNTGGTAVTGGNTQTIDLGASEWAVVYFYVESTIAGCTEASATVVWDSWVFNSPAISGPPGGSVFCDGETVELSNAFPGPVVFQWFKDGNMMIGETNSTLEVTMSGTYTLEVAYAECPNYFLNSGVGPTINFVIPTTPTITQTGNTLMSTSAVAYQWSFNGVEVSGANQQSFEPTEEGAYTVTTTDANGCEATSEAFDFVIMDIDADMDGYNDDVDCDDNNPGVNPGATEIPNNDVDEDCDGIAQVIDEDMDGYNSDEDCDDNNPGVNPGATEIPNNDVDEDCDGIAQVIDIDMDGFNSDEDCDDLNPNVNPDEIEIPNNNIDEDCDGIILIIDEDMDGFNSDEDCDDTNAGINPDAVEIPNNDVDEDCDGIVLVIDEDMDGFNSDEDCDDTNPDINPDAIEIPNNGVDENCDGEDAIVDLDMDGFNSNEDCDDTNPDINPDAVEIPNNDVDENCDGIILVIDEDMDGFNSDEDCDDANADINPDAIEIPNNDIDEDCDGIAQVIDEDMDGFNSDEDCDDNNPDANPDQIEIPNNDVDEDCDGIAQVIDEDMDGFNSDEDCDDNNFDINPDAIEIPNNDIDEDCDGVAQIIDEDMDGFNSDEDCDDTNADINPDAIEIPDNDIDEDCDGEDLITISTFDLDQNKVNVYPNPTRNSLMLEIEEEAIGLMSITDCLGKTVISGDYTGNKTQIDVSSLMPGVYYIRLMDLNVSTVFVVVE